MAIIISGFLLILAMIFIKYKPVYEVTIAGEKLGYIEKVDEFKNLIEEKIINQEGEYIANISLIEEPEYNLKLLSRTSNLNEEELIEKLKECNTITTYKYYEVALNNEIKSYVKTIEEAEKVVNDIKEEFANDIWIPHMEELPGYNMNAFREEYKNMQILRRMLEEFRRNGNK